jgi:hypothetical protein
MRGEDLLSHDRTVWRAVSLAHAVSSSRVRRRKQGLGNTVHIPTAVAPLTMPTSLWRTPRVPGRRPAGIGQPGRIVLTTCEGPLACRPPLKCTNGREKAIPTARPVEVFPILLA